MFGLPKLSADPVLFLPLWLGTLRDHSGNGNHVVSAQSPIHWTARGGVDYVNSNGGWLTLNSDTSLEVSQLSVFLSGSFASQLNNEYIIRAMSGGPWFYLSATGLIVYDGSDFSIGTADIKGATSIGCTVATGPAKAKFYVDGVHAGTGVNDITINAGVSSWRVLATSAPNYLRSPVTSVAMSGAEWTDDDMSFLHGWSNNLVTPRKQWPGGGLTIASPTYTDNIQSARSTLADETSGQLSNTGLQITTGTWAMREDSISRYIYCVSAGRLDHGLIGASGDITKSFVATNATITKEATGFHIDASTGGIIREIVLVEP